MNRPKTLRFPFLRIAAAAAALVLASCKSGPSGGGSWGNYDVAAYRPQNPSNVKVAVSTSTQTVYVKEGSRVLLASPCCVGKAGSPTPSGSFRIFSKQANRRRVSEPGAGYPMPYWCEFASAYGFHGGWLHPMPATHGCIRMPWKVAPKLYNLVRIGTPVHIAYSQPEDATAGRGLQHPDERPAPEWPPSVLNTNRIFQHCGSGTLQ